jgi:hypothetical protein
MIEKKIKDVISHQTHSLLKRQKYTENKEEDSLSKDIIAIKACHDDKLSQNKLPNKDSSDKLTIRIPKKLLSCSSQSDATQSHKVEESKNMIARKNLHNGSRTIGEEIDE